jgi:hypothetical protein
VERKRGFEVIAVFRAVERQCREEAMPVSVVVTKDEILKC